MGNESSISSDNSKKLEAILKKLETARFNQAASYTVRAINATSFTEWAEYAVLQNDPDAIRNTLYYGFQPLFDILMTEELPQTHRRIAIELFDEIIRLSKRYLVGYYTGQPDTAIINRRSSFLDEKITQLSSVPYKTKFRVIDSNQVYSANINSFLTQYIQQILDAKIPMADYVVCCACGASELAIPLAGLLGTELGFIRRSKRRGDKTPKCLPEHETSIKTATTNNCVVCVEDIVSSGGSLKMIMEQITSYSPSSVLGLSCGYNYDLGTGLKHELNKENLHMYSLSKP